MNNDKLERLAILSEECSEVIKIINKTLRHGEDSCHPDDLTKNNKILLSEELGDLMYAIRLCVVNEDVNQDVLEDSYASRPERLKKYIHYNTLDND